MDATSEQKMMASRVGADPRWQALLDRDPAFEGKFVYSVKTTGVYCRPSCAARRAKPENIGFHDTCAQAEAAGFRACLRCRPNDISSAERNATLIAAACRTIENAEEPPTLSALAASVGLSAFHFQRLFKSVTGVTPKAYGAAARAKRVRALLSQPSGSVTAAIYESGYNSNSRFYEASSAILGMTPSAFRDGGAEAEIRFALGRCSIGEILVACSAKGVCAILLGDDPEALIRDLQDRFAKAHIIGGDQDFEAIVAGVIGFLEAPATGLDLPLDIRGTAFQQRVWQALRAIPSGETASYREIAEQIGMPKAARAVAQACATNALAVAIPCHRVVRNNGDISGYRWGIERKRALLAREAAAS